MREVNYNCQFKNNNNHDVFVSLSYIDDGTEDETKEFKVTYDEPIIITQNGDSIYEPLKTQGCTINMFTDEIHWDLYTPNPTAIKVRVWNWEGTDLFNGYLTPCIYSQDYAYNGVLTLEAVDYLAVLDTKKYTTIENDKGIYTADRIIRHIIFDNIPAYSGETWNDTDKLQSLLEEVTLDDIKLQESNFFDDNDEAMTCKEVLEEICKYLGASMGMYDDKIWIWDYDNCSLSDSPTTLLTRKYGAGTPTIELDDVYSKISINCNQYEITDKDIIYNPFDEDSNELINVVKYNTSSQATPTIYADYSFSWRSPKHHTKDKDKGRIYVKPYYLVTAGDVLPVQYKVSKWLPIIHKLYNGSLSDDFIGTRILQEISVDDDGKKVWFPYYTNAYFTKVLEYNMEEGISITPQWENIIVFPSCNKTYLDTALSGKIHTDSSGYVSTIDFDVSNLEYEALKYVGDINIPFSISDGISWIVINGDLWYQRTFDARTNKFNFGSNENDDVQIYNENDKPYPFPFDNITYNTAVVHYKDKELLKMCSHDKDDTNHNKGWGCLKAKLKIGDKYWNGTAWTTTESTFYIKYHDSDVTLNETEYLSYFTWLKPVTNTTYIDKLDKDGFAVPITANDKLSGKVEFTLYTPKQIINNPDDNNTTLTITTPRFTNSGCYTDSAYKLFCPNIFMKDFSLEYVYTDNLNWADDKPSDDDIVYENVIDKNYSTEFSDLALKINSWYQYKPISRSYALDSDNIPITTLTHNKVGETGTEDVVQEAWLLQKYYNHYKTPKKILNLNYKLDDYPPFIKFRHLPTNTTYSVISYENNVKAAEINFKMIEL